MTAAAANSSPPDGELTLPCTEPGCTEEVTGKPAGAGSAAMKLGLHKRRAHGIVGSKKAQARAEDAELSGEEGRTRQIVAGVRDMASSISATKRTPTAEDLGKAFGRGLSLTTVIGASVAVESDPTIPPGEDGAKIRDATIAALSLAERPATAIMHPIGRVLAPTKLNARYGRAVVDNVDVLGSFAELVILAKNWRDYLRERRAAIAYMNEGQVVPFPGLAAVSGPATPPPMTPAGPGAGSEASAPPAPGPGQSPPPTQGIIVTPDMVAKMQRGER